MEKVGKEAFPTRAFSSSPYFKMVVDTEELIRFLLFTLTTSTTRQNN